MGASPWQAFGLRFPGRRSTPRVRSTFHEIVKTMKHVSAQHPVIPELLDLVETFGLFFERFGIKRNVGRIWGVLYVSPAPLSQAEICGLIGLSTGLVSTALKELEQWGAVKVVVVRGSRSTHYDTEENLIRIVSTILHKRELETVRRLREVTRRTRLAYRPVGYAARFERRLKAVETMCDLYEGLTSMIHRMVRFPSLSIPAVVQFTEKSRFLEGMLTGRSRAAAWLSGQEGT